LRFVRDDDLDPAVVGAAFGAGVVGDWVTFAKSVGLDQVTLVASLYQIAANCVRPTLREV
jgi:hypothetical protein